jgi:hypothetical protein
VSPIADDIELFGGIKHIGKCAVLAHDNLLSSQPTSSPIYAKGGQSRGRSAAPLTCLSPLRADALEWNVAGAADAKESTAIRATRELKEEIFRIPQCAY